MNKYSQKVASHKISCLDEQAADQRKSWHKPTKPNFTSLNNVIFICLPQFQWKRLYCKGQKRHSEQAAAMGMLYPDEESQTIETPPTLLHHGAAFAKNTTKAGLLNQLKHAGSAPLTWMCLWFIRISLSFPSILLFIPRCLSSFPPSSHSFFHFIPCHLSPRLTDTQPVFNGQGSEKAN